MSVNRVTLLGNVGADPDIHQGDNFKVAKLALATSEKIKDIEKTEWHSLVFFGNIADVVEKFVTKGKKIYIEGKLKYSSWGEGTDKKYKTEIVVNTLVLL